MNVLRWMCIGFWQGIGVEFSFLMLWIGWHFLHRRVAHKFDAEHFFHKIHAYFAK